MQSYGDEDGLVPVHLAQQLFAAAPGRKRFFVNPGGGHNDPQPEEYHQLLDEFLEELTR